MTFPSRFSRISLAACIALLSCTALGWQRAAAPTELQRGLLFADLWMQTSAEYVACCLQTYHLAGDIIEQDLRQFRTSESAQPVEKRLPPAIIMDLDETVLDNSTFQTFLYESGQDYSDPAYNKFVSDYRLSIRLVPGAKEFIDRVESLGITVAFITNREEMLRQATIDSLAQGGVNVKGLDDPNGLRMLTQKHGESIKKPRRDLVRAKYHVLAYFGDQLGDFSDEFTANNGNTAAARVDLAAGKYRELWGTRWFVLPNPVYGQWQVVLLKAGNPQQFLRRAKP
jgi:5'-nucleotidase (lipoprotein e(P4) family)